MKMQAISAISLVPFVAAISLIGVAVFSLWKTPDQRTSRMLALGLLSVSVVEVCKGFATISLSPFTQLSWMRLALLTEWLWPACWLPFSLNYARASTPVMSTRLKSAIALMALLPLAVGVWGWSTLLALPTDSADHRYLFLSTWGRIFTGLALAGLAVPLINLEATLRASTGLGRWQVKFMLLGVGLMLGFETYLHSHRLLFSAVDGLMLRPQAVITIIAAGLITVSLMRNRRGVIALAVSQSAVFGSAVLLLIGGYLIVVSVLTQLWASADHDVAERWQGAFLFLAIIGLISLLLSTRVKVAIKQWLSQHVYPHHYDYRLEWLRLTEETSRQFGLDATLRVVVARLSELFNAPRVSAWLFDDTHQRLRLAAMVQLPTDEATALRDHPIMSPTLAMDLPSWDGPRIVDHSAVDAGSPAARELAALVRETQARIAAPLVLGGRALGVLAIGDRVAGQAYGAEELLLIGAIAQQSAASVLTARLAQEVMRTREAELSQLYSTFLVHDLKNLGTTLLLVAQNLPMRYTDPKFRDDAQRVMHDITAKIKEMVERLKTLRQDYEPVMELTDLNRLAQESVQSLDAASAPTVAFEPDALPPLKLDRGQLHSVLTNLLLNAKEASRQTGGHIRLRTERQNGWASLSVIDDGCGMPPEFIAQHLFQPFRSTKPGGLGIGLYQCRKIIDAHGGRITVDSRQGVGTIVTILLPIPAESSPC